MFKLKFLALLLSIVLLNACEKSNNDMKETIISTAPVKESTTANTVDTADKEDKSTAKQAETIIEEEAVVEEKQIPIDPANATALIETKLGNIKLRFFYDVAPKHVENFVKLSQSGFYDETIFHRVIPGFMIQGGDPNTKDKINKTKYGQGGPGHTVKSEFNNKSHKRGILSMARSGHPDSAGSQFFIVVSDSTFLDNQYTVFGEVIEGMDVADKIVSQERDARDNPFDRIEMKVSIRNN